MNIKKVLLSSIIIFLLAIVSVSFVYAYDKDVVCSDSCSGFDGALFSELDLKPGDEIEKSFCIENERDENISVLMTAEEQAGGDENIKNILELETNEIGGSLLFDGNLKNFLTQEIDLGNIDQNISKCYEISVYFPHRAGNEYQNKSTVFDLILRITGEDSGEEEVLSTESSDDDESSSGNILGSVLGLSDTSGHQNSILYILGFTLTVFGLTLISKRKRKINEN